MCGIIGYVGSRQSSDIIVDGLRKLEYRGYDSAGIAILRDGQISIRRAAGKLDKLAQSLIDNTLHGTTGIGHTRWATHGGPTENNAHPHSSDGIVLVHNGIIENHLDLKSELMLEGRVFSSETDTEIMAHLIAREKSKGLGITEAVRKALRYVRGAYALAVLDQDNPDLIVAAKNASPLVIGLGDGENFLASDTPAILNHTRKVIFLEEGEMALLEKDRVSLLLIESGEAFERHPQTITWSATMAEKNGYKHFMLKEIHEQPQAIVNTLRGKLRVEHSDVDLPGLKLKDSDIKEITRIVVLACGTSWHAGLIGEFLIEKIARIPVEVELASEFRYRSPVIDNRTLVVAISQSGETADTLAAMQEASRKGAHLLGICNVVGSAIARFCPSNIMTHAGPEISVASTKAFTSQIAALYLLAIKLGISRNSLPLKEAQNLIQAIIEAPSRMEEVLQKSSRLYADIARRFGSATSMLFLGRGLAFPIALEGALKLKELSYIHAEGYAAGEMKHGPIALIDETVPTVVLCPVGPTFEKTLSNLSEIKARGGPVIAITTEGWAAERIASLVDVVLPIPEVPELVQPLLTSLPMQLIAYHIADFKGTDVDQPRNLAKSVTVE